MTRQEKINKIKNATDTRIKYLLSLKNNEEKSLKFIEQFDCEYSSLFDGLWHATNHALENPFEELEDYHGPSGKRIISTHRSKCKFKDYIEKHLGTSMNLLMQDRWEWEGSIEWYPNEFYNGLSDLNKEITLFIDVYRIVTDQNFEIIKELNSIFFYLRNLKTEGFNASLPDEELFDKQLDLVLQKQEQINYVPIEERNYDTSK